MADIPAGLFLFACFGGSLVYQLTFFLIAYNCQIDKVTDLAGTSNFVWLALASFLTYEKYDLFHILLNCALFLWGIRLGAYLVIRVLKRGHDARFNTMRQRWQHFIVFWIFQLFWAYIGTLPIMLSNIYAPAYESLTASQIVGLSIFLLGFIIEFIADQHKFNFNSLPLTHRQPYPWVSTGFYSFLRYPNYLGEIMLWFGFAIATAEGLSEAGAYVALGFIWLSPLLTTWLLSSFSGVPKSEEAYEERYGSMVDWQEYKKKTWKLIPFVW